MMIFGASDRESERFGEGSQHYRGQARDEFQAIVNRWRAGSIADIIAAGAAVQRVRLASGEIYAYPNPRIQRHLFPLYHYAADTRATLQALADLLEQNRQLRAIAEADGITVDAIEEMIERSSDREDLDG